MRTLSKGARVAHYDILRLLGRGGMGEVYLARDLKLERPVALKMVRPEALGSADAVARFIAEAKTTARFNHPHIVTIYEVGAYEGSPYMALEYLEGASLRDRMDEGPVELAEALRLTSEIARAVAEAHRHGVLHRDLKPANVMLPEDGPLRVLDFGLAKVQRAASPWLWDRGAELDPTLDVGRGAAGDAPDRTGAGCGTPAYMSPEQWRGEPCSEATDVWALGVILYELLSGTRPFPASDAEHLVALALEVATTPTPPLGERCDAPPAVVAMVERCLEKDPAARPRVEELAEALARVHREPEVRGWSGGGAAHRVRGLPASAGQLLGRDREIAEVRALILERGVRLVTLSGPGGSGKTRLAMQLASELADRYEGRVCFVPLASLTDAALVTSAIARALEVRPSGSRSVLESLRDLFGDPACPPTLLVLDNFEQVLDAAPSVAELLEAGSALSIVVTSREVLRIYGEHEYAVPPLPLPEGGEAAAELAHNPAVALFRERAAAVRGDLEWTDEVAAQVAEICRRLDGLPLAIELAAARTKLLPPAAILARLENRLKLLTGGGRDRPERQQTLRGAIAWSYDLLDDSERRLLGRLSVFAGAFTLEGVEAVCDTARDLGVDVLDGVTSLLDKSLLQARRPLGDEPRFGMLETIREYAAERLADDPEEEARTRRCHAAYCLVLAEERGTDPAAERRWLARCDVEHDNFRAAHDALLESGDVAWSLRLSSALFFFWQRRAHFAEGRERLRRSLALAGADEPTPARAKALFCLGVLAHEARDFAEAEAVTLESVETYRELGDEEGLAVAYNALGVISRREERYDVALDHFRRGVEIWRRLGRNASMVRAATNLATTMRLAGDLAGSRALYEECLAIYRELGDRPGVAWTVNQRAELARDEGDLAGARALFEESLEEFRALDHPWGIATSLVDLAELASAEGDHAGARARYREALRIVVDLRHERGMARVLEGLALAAVRQSLPGRALFLAGAAEGLRERVGVSARARERERLDAELGPLLAEHGRGEYERGLAAPVEEAIGRALEAD